MEMVRSASHVRNKPCVLDFTSFQCAFSLLASSLPRRICFIPLLRLLSHNCVKLELEFLINTYFQHRRFEMIEEDDAPLAKQFIAEIPELTCLYKGQEDRGLGVFD